ncbi:MAG: ATP-binding cassette domain-containing protein [Pseudomonadota bacterium]
MRAVDKSFGGVRALNNVDLVVEPGEIVGLIGPNGSGKTSLVNIITGVYRPDAGTVVLAGRAIAGLAVHDIARAGIARTFQNLNLVDDMTVLDSVAVARRRDRDLARARGHAMALIERLGSAMSRCGRAASSPRG